MSDKAWKQFEREIARLIKGRRYWANSGESIDIISKDPNAPPGSPYFIAQCKLVQRMSLSELTELAESISVEAYRQTQPEPEASEVHGFVAVKLRRGRGRVSTALIVMTVSDWQRCVRKELLEGGART